MRTFFGAYLWVPSRNGSRGDEKDLYGTTSSIKFDSNPNVLTPLFVAHEFSDFILRKKFNPTSNGLIHLDGRQTSAISDYPGVPIRARFGLIAGWAPPMVFTKVP